MAPRTRYDLPRVRHPVDGRRSGHLGDRPDRALPSRPERLRLRPVVVPDGRIGQPGPHGTDPRQAVGRPSLNGTPPPLWEPATVRVLANPEGVVAGATRAVVLAEALPDVLLAHVDALGLGGEDADVHPAGRL